MNEEERAVFYRSQRQARRQAEQSRLLALRGDCGARAELDMAWQPFYLAMVEAKMAAEGEDLIESPQVA